MTDILTKIALAKAEFTKNPPPRIYGPGRTSREIDRGLRQKRLGSAANFD